MFKNKIYELYRNICLDKNEAGAEFRMILDALNISSTLKLLNDDFSVDEQNKILDIVEQRIKTKRPLQHILGFAYFMGHKYFVNNDVLIPRPETEILVEACSGLVLKNSKILDIGTGSGCIAIELSKYSNIPVDAVDISENALKTAKKNAKLHNANCNFFKSDLFSNINKKYDLIVSNPPYIPISQINTLDITVKNFEPHAALFANDELGIDIYKKIVANSVTYLNEGGVLAFEIGINQSEYIVEMLEKCGFSAVKVINDLNGIERVTICHKIFA